MDTVTTEAPTNTIPDDRESFANHLKSAEEFFTPKPPAADAPPAKPDPKPAAPDAPKKPDLVSSILKTPSKPAETKPDVAPVAPDEFDKGLVAPRSDSPARAGWDELKKRASERAAADAARIRELEAKTKDAPPPAADEATKARLIELEQQNKTFSERLKVLDLQSHPEFVEKYVAPKKAALEELSAIAKGDEVEVKIDEILSKKGKAFNTAVSEALEAMSPYARVQFQSALDRYIAADIAGQKALSSADEFLKSANQNAGSRSRAAFDKAASEFAGHLSPAAVDEKAPDEEKAAAAEYNAALAGVVKTAEQYAFGQMDEAGVAALAHKAALYEFTVGRALPRLSAVVEKEIATREARIAELEGKVKALTAANPDISGGSGGGGGEGTPNENESHLDAAKRYKWSV